MPAGDIQCSMVFKETVTGKDLGWVETHYHVTAAALDPAMTALIALANLRSRMLGVGVILQALKVSDATIWRDSLVRPGPPARTVGGSPVYNPRFTSKTTYVADFAYASCLARMESTGAPLYRRSMWLSGNPDEAQDIFRRDPTGDPIWNQAWIAYRDALAPVGGVGGQWGFRVKSRDQGETGETLISDIDETTGILAVAGAPALLANGQYVILRNVRGLTPRLAGQYQIVNRADSGGVALLTLDRVGTAGGGEAFAGTYTGTGYVRLLVRKTVPYRSAALVRFSKKARGGPLNRARGRLKTPALKI